MKIRLRTQDLTVAPSTQCLAYYCGHANGRCGHGCLACAGSLGGGDF